jgi:hypothetical protein
VNSPASEILNSRSNGNMHSTQVLKPVQSFDPYRAVQVVSCTLMLSPGTLIPNNRCKNADAWRTDPSVSLDLSVGFRNEICGRICCDYREFCPYLNRKRQARHMVMPPLAFTEGHANGAPSLAG